jgi:hypothetical protein
MFFVIRRGRNFIGFALLKIVEGQNRHSKQQGKSFAL